MKAIGYIRVSTDHQVNGTSLNAQKAKIQAMATIQGAELLEIVMDAGESAKSLKRPGVEQLLQMVDRKEVDSVIVLKLDRLTRSVRDLADLLDLFDKRGVSLVSVEESLDTSTAAGRLVLNVMASVSQWEREIIGERTSTALQHKKSQGERIGGIPFGYQLGPDGVHLEENLEEQEILSKMKKLRHAGLSYQVIADELNSVGFVTRGAGPWKKQNVHQILKNAA